MDTQICKNLSVQMYSKVIKTVIETNSIQNAEMSKMIENVYRAINIGLVNELKMLCYKMNLNIYDILSLSETKPFGLLSLNLDRNWWTLYSNRSLLSY